MSKKLFKDNVEKINHNKFNIPGSNLKFFTAHQILVARRRIPNDVWKSYLQYSCNDDDWLVKAAVPPEYTNGEEVWLPKIVLDQINYYLMHVCMLYPKYDVDKYFAQNYIETVIFYQIDYLRFCLETNLKFTNNEPGNPHADDPKYCKPILN